MPVTAEAAVAQIRAAFPAEPIDFKGALTGGMDGGAYFRAVDGKRWTELDREFLSHSNSALSFMAVKHIAMVLPLYLWGLVEDGSKTAMPYTLLPVLGGDRRFDELFAALTAPQHEAVIAALDVFADDREDQPARAARAASARWRAATT